MRSIRRIWRESLDLARLIGQENDMSLKSISAVFITLVLFASTAQGQKPSSGASYPVAQLARVMGELHYFSFRCQGEEAQYWRTEMLNMLELEAPVRGPVRTRLIRAFNDGYGEHDRHRTRCGAYG